MTKTTKIKSKIKSKFISFFNEYKKENKEQFKSIKLRECQKEAMEMIDKTINKREESMLLNMTCGTGKTMVECFTINYFAHKLEEENKRGIFCFGSHRLLLNKQLIDELNRFIPDLENRFVIRVASSDTDKYDKFEKNYIDSNLKKDLKKKHVIVISCAKTMNINSDKNDKNDMNLYKLMKANKLKFECAVLDEAHKDLTEQTIKNIKEISNFFMGCTATAGKKFKTWFNEIYSFTFAQALKAGNTVVPPHLYVAYNRFSDKLNHKVSMVKYAFEHLKKNETKAQLCCFFNSVDNLCDISNTLLNDYTDVNICVLASHKNVAVLDENGNKTGGKKVITCMWNGEMVDKETVLSKLKENKDKNCIILSAFMIQEGIDISSINGVGIFCRKADASLYQAICRGDRYETGKTHFNVYVSADLIEENNSFIRDLVFGFENKMSFEGSIGDKGKGSKEKDKELENLITVKAEIIKTIKTNFEKYSKDFSIENEKIEFWNNFTEDMKNAGTPAKADKIFMNKYFDKITGNDFNKVNEILNKIYG